jgi:haloacetate dehalogenase
MAGLMEQLDYQRYSILAHDRGARVAHRLALDFEGRVERMVILDIAPTREMYANTSKGFARDYYHWFFLIQPHPYPEWMIGADPERYVRTKCGSGSAGLSPFTEEALGVYVDAYRDPASIHATCEDYRAAATIDIEHDNADGGKKLSCPLKVLWGKHGVIEKHFDCLALWQQRADHVSGNTLPGGHYLAEELPEMVAEETVRFVRDQKA